MKKFLTFLFVGLFLAFAVTQDVSAAKKSSKLSKEAVQQMSDDIDNLTKKYTLEHFYHHKIMKR